MKLEALRKSSKNTLKNEQERLAAVKEAEERLGKCFTEFTDEEEAQIPVGPSMHQILDAKRMLVVCDLAESMTEDEKLRLANIPVYKDDVRECKDIKDKYGLSWNELRMVRDFFQGEKKQTPQDRYQAEHARRYVVKCFDRTEQDMIDWLEQKPNKSGYIKELIKADMAKAK